VGEKGEKEEEGAMRKYTFASRAEREGGEETRTRLLGSFPSSVDAAAAAAQLVLSGWASG